MKKSIKDLVKELVKETEEKELEQTKSPYRILLEENLMLKNKIRELEKNKK